MVESIYNELLTRYNMGKAVLNELAKKKEIDDLGEYDFRLVSIMIKDIDEDDDQAQRFIELRCRKDENKDYEEIVVVTGKVGGAKPVETPEKTIREAAELLEKISENVCREFENKVLVWDYLGD